MTEYDMNTEVYLEWVGLACFRVWTRGSPIIVMDPYTPSAIGLTTKADLQLCLQGDMVICSSLTDIAHSNYELVEGSPTIINALDVAQGHTQSIINGEPLIAVQAAESPDHPTGPDDNALYGFRVAGLWFVHMGDVGFGLDNDKMKPFKDKCDVLLALVGEGLTLDLDELEPMVNYLKPTWIVPMHYNLAPVTGFSPHIMTTLSSFIKRNSQNEIVYTHNHTVTFPQHAPSVDNPTIVVLEPSGYKPTTSDYL